jgi:hypothetical protein
MPHVRVEEELPASRDAVWALIRDFADLGAWAPEARVVKLEGEGIGCIRHVDTPLGPFVERCEAHDEPARSFSYCLLESPVPFENYVAVVKLKERDADSCLIEWSCDFECAPDQEEFLVSGVEATYRDGFISSLRSAVEAARP